MRRILSMLVVISGIQGYAASIVCIVSVKSSKITEGAASCSTEDNKSRSLEGKPAQALGNLLNDGFKIINVSSGDNPNSEWSLVYTLSKEK